MRTLIAALLATIALARSAPAGDATGGFAPYEDLLEVLADLTWHLRDDTYRFPTPKDPTGHDLYRLSLHRLQNWELRYPGRLRDVTAFGRAEACERLGEYAKAADAYGQVAKLPSPLAERAREGAERAGAFAATATMSEEAGDLEATLAALRQKLEAWGKLVQRYTGTPWEPMALAEEERVERLTARLVVEHRRQLADGATVAERSLRFLIEKHADSKNLSAHILSLGDLYASLARDYVEQHDRPLAFDEDEFVRRADRALDTYRKVSTWDGASEKPEAQARFAGLDAWKTAVLGRYR
jgi:tetratricopeptide (TPR) repeat protein